MSGEIRLVRLGSVNSGDTAIMANVSYLGSQSPVAVTLSTDYTLENPGEGFPVRPFLTGRVPQPEFPYTVTAGSTIALLECEAAALIAASAATEA